MAKLKVLLLYKITLLSNLYCEQKTRSKVLLLYKFTLLSNSYAQPTNDSIVLLLYKITLLFLMYQNCHIKEQVHKMDYGLYHRI